MRGEAAELPRGEQRAGREPALFIPVGSEATFYFPIEEEGTLSLDGVRVQGNTGKTLQVIARADGGAEQVLETIDASRGPHALELPGRGARLVEVALRAVPVAADATGGFQLLAPTVRTQKTQWTASAEDAGSGKPNIIIYLVDTLRADHVGTYGGGSLTPNMDAFAREATVFENTIAQAPWTKPSVAALFTGRGPLSHGVRLLHDRLPQEADTAAELLSAAGYQTAAFSTNWHIRNETGMDQGFGFFDFSPDEAASDKLNRRVVRWLEYQAPKNREKPFFLYVHALDPHEPYTPPPDYRKKYAPDVREEAGYDFDLKRVDNSRGKERRKYMEELRPLYKAEVAFNDHSFGDFLEVLRVWDLYDRSLIVLVADHGEEFDEHGARGHTSHLYAETPEHPADRQMAGPAARAAGGLDHTAHRRPADPAPGGRGRGATGVARNGPGRGGIHRRGSGSAVGTVGALASQPPGPGGDEPGARGLEAGLSAIAGPGTRDAALPPRLGSRRDREPHRRSPGARRLALLPAPRRDRAQPEGGPPTRAHEDR